MTLMSSNALVLKMNNFRCAVYSFMLTFITNLFL